eukprot:UN17238
MLFFKKNFKVTALFLKEFQGREVGNGEIMCFNKRRVAAETQRQLRFWCVEYLDE